MVDKKETYTLTLEEILNQLGISNQNNKDSHCAVAKRTTVILKRDLDECWINPYIITIICCLHGMGMWISNLQLMHTAALCI